MGFFDKIKNGLFKKNNGQQASDENMENEVPDDAAAEKAEAERIAAEKAEAERIAAEKAEAERIVAEKAEAERIAAEEAEAERIAAEKAEAERIAAEKAEAERIAAEKAEAERIAAEKAEAERIAAEKAEAERIAAEKAEAERIAAEKAEAERIAAEKAEAERIAAEEAEIPEEPAEKKKGFFEKLKAGLKKTREQIAGGMDNLLNGYAQIDDDFYEELEEALVMSDIGIYATENILEDLREKVKDGHVREAGAVKELLIESIKSQMVVPENAYEFENKTSVVLVVGVNGVGKTTTVGKLASKQKALGRRVMLSAADTFRAGAISQLKEWSNRAGVEIIAGNEGQDPGAVVFDSVKAAKARNVDILLCDTAGRLNNKKNLMAELKKINDIITREYPDCYRETLLVLDGSTGQNALMQAKEFSQVTDVTGIVLTKLDGSAKGGIAVAIQAELKIPVKYIGVGEGIDDLEKFDPDDFVRAIV